LTEQERGKLEKSKVYRPRLLIRDVKRKDGIYRDIGGTGSIRLIGGAMSYLIFPKTSEKEDIIKG